VIGRRTIATGTGCGKAGAGPGARRMAAPANDRHAAAEFGVLSNSWKE
jgi:hypothetical protein